MTERQPSSLYYKIVDPQTRLALATSLSVLVYLLLPTTWKFQIRLLLSWDLGLAFLLIILVLMMNKTDAEHTWKRAQRQEPSSIRILCFCVIACGTSWAAIAFMLNDGQEWPKRDKNLLLCLCLAAIFCSWLLVHAFFALHYARIYYDETDNIGGDSFSKGLNFPGSEIVDYWDFMYYAFTIGMCYQTSDVEVTSEPVRRLTLIHSVLSFFFVAAIIGLVVNLVSNVM